MNKVQYRLLVVCSTVILVFISSCSQAQDAPHLLEATKTVHLVEVNELERMISTQKIISYNMDQIKWEFSSLSPDGRLFAFMAESEGVLGDHDYYVTVNDVVFGPYEDIVRERILFSPDSKRVAYEVIEGGKAYVYVDDEQQGPYDSVGDIVFSPDSQHIGYKAQVGSDQFVVIDGINGVHFDSVDNPHFSPDNNHLMYSVKRDDKWTVKIDEVDGKWYDDAYVHPVDFSPDSQRSVYQIRDGVSEYLILDGMELGPYDQILCDSMVFSDDSEHFSFLSFQVASQQVFLHLDNDMLGPFELATGIVFSPDGQRTAYAFKEGEDWFILLDGERIGTFEHLLQGSFTFSPNSERFVYGYGESDKSYIVDGEEVYGPYDGVARILFSHNSDSVLVVAVEDDEYFLVQGGIENKRYDAIIQNLVTISMDDRWIAYPARDGNKSFVVVNGEEGKHFDYIIVDSVDDLGITFNSDDSLHYFAIERDEILFVEEELGY